MSQKCLSVDSCILTSWNAVPGDIKAETTLSSFKAKLKSFYFVRLYQIFDGDNVRTFKLICPKCRKVNIFSVCSC